MFSARAVRTDYNAWYTEIKAFQAQITNKDYAEKGYGMSVRCVQERR